MQLGAIQLVPEICINLDPVKHCSTLGEWADSSSPTIGVQLRAQRGASGCHGERGSDASQSLFDITAHHLRGQPQYAIPEPTEVTITPRIGGALQLMRAIINFNDKASTGSDEICNVLAANRHLPPKDHSQLFAGDAAPKNGFRFGEIVPEEVSALTEQSLKLELLT